MTALLALFAALVQPPAGTAVPGTYMATAQAQTCRVVLMPPAMRPPESRLQTETVSGLAVVEPGCPLALANAGLWTLHAGEDRLVLTSQAGEPLWTGARAETGWTGTGPDGDRLVLARS